MLPVKLASRGGWDWLRLFTPVRYNSLPGSPFPGEPYALPVKDNVATYLQAYVAHFALPVRLNTRVSSLVTDEHRFVVTTDGKTFAARSVIVSTGAYHRACIPPFAGALSRSLAQLHSSEYRNPGALPPGSVLAVGVSNGHPRLEDGRVLEDVRAVVWCTGFRPDFRWIELPVFGPEGYPEHRRGIVAAAPGLGFVGWRYQYRIGSSLIGGVREDAQYVIRRLASHDAHTGRASAAAHHNLKDL